MSLARRALARADPCVEQTECDLRFVELHYGPVLAASLRAEFTRRRLAESTLPR